MAKITVPGLKSSTGMKSFEPLSSGRYTLKVLELKVEPSKRSPCDVWKFTFEVEKGPEQDDGRNPKGRKLYHNVSILQPNHPSFETVTMGVDELKSMVVAFGVVFKGDDLDPDKFLGLSSEADVTVRLEKNQDDEEVKRNRIARWIEVK